MLHLPHLRCNIIYQFSTIKNFALKHKAEKNDMI